MPFGDRSGAGALDFTGHGAHRSLLERRPSISCLRASNVRWSIHRVKHSPALLIIAGLLPANASQLRVPSAKPKMARQIDLSPTRKESR